MNINEMTLEQLEQRTLKIKEEMVAEDADLRSLNEEMDLILARKNALVEERKTVIEEVINGKGEEIKTQEKKEMKDLKEVRSSVAYAEAYAEYLKNGDATECRSLLSELATPGEGDTGAVPVPYAIEERIRTAWDNDEIMSRVSKSYIRGVLKIGFEVSASDAGIHEEGADALPEEQLVLGVATLLPKNIKKWISISDEAMDLHGEAFLDYIYDEIEHKLAKKAADEVIADIIAAPATSSSTVPAVPVLANAPVAVSTPIMAEAMLSDEARNLVIIMNKQTVAAFKAITTADGYLAQNPFDGMTVITNNSLPVYSAASAGDTYAIVGDLGSGFRANFPNGMESKFIFDDKSLAEEDLVKIVGRKYVGMGVVAPYRFVKITK